MGQDGVVIRLVFLLRRSAGLSLSEFSDRWRLDHGPIVAGHQTTLGVLRYTQTHRVEDSMNEAMARARGGMEEPYDGVAELWWSSEEALRDASGSDAGRRAGEALLADEAEFIDLAASPLWLAHEYPQVNPTPETIVAHAASRIVKLHFPLRHPETMSMDVAQRYWRIQHGPLIRSMAPAMGMLRYQQVHRFETPLEAALREPGYACRALHRPRRGVVRARRRTAAGGGRGRATSDRGRADLHRLRTLGDLDRQGTRLRRSHLKGPPVHWPWATEHHSQERPLTTSCDHGPPRPAPPVPAPFIA